MSFRMMATWLTIFVTGSVQAQTAPVFETDVLPILTANCLQCHGGLRQRNGLDLRTLASIRKGGESGAAVQAGQPDKSLLWQKIATDEMPKGLTKLTPEDKKILRDWIAADLPKAQTLAEIKVARSGKPRAPAVVAAEIDRDIDRQLDRSNVKPAAPADDHEFLRRVYLDILGRVPTSVEARTFLDSKEADKRSKVIDDLLARPEYGKHWGTVWHNLLVPLKGGQREYDDAFIGWLSTSFNESRGWNTTVAEMLTADGPVNAVPKAGFLAANLEDQGPNKVSALSSRVFLGVNLDCAECHNHPLAEWKQTEYWGLAAFFSRVSRTRGPKGTLAEIDRKVAKGAKSVSGAAIAIPDTALTNVGTVVKARFPGGAELKIDALPYRPVLASWLTSAENPYFAPNAANRWWAHFFGRGFVNPLDGFEIGHPPSHPQALALLAEEFRASGHDSRHLIRSICNTRAYQRTSRTKTDDAKQLQLFARMPVRLPSPESLYGNLTQALGVRELNLTGATIGAGVPRGANQPRTIFVNSFELSDDEEDPLKYSHGVLQILRFLNRPEFNQGGEIAKTLAASKKAPAEAIEELYLRTLTRRPSDTERERLLAFVARQNSPREAYAAVLWLLINQHEFILNH